MEDFLQLPNNTHMIYQCTVLFSEIFRRGTYRKKQNNTIWISLDIFFYMFTKNSVTYRAIEYLQMDDFTSNLSSSI